MIDYEDRLEVHAKMRKGDLPVAQELYTINTGRTISVQYLSFFITCRKPCDGIKKGCHSPEEMYRAICQAISQRQTRNIQQKAIAAQIRASTFEAPLAAAY